jgi:hypothetical protein
MLHMSGQQGNPPDESEENRLYSPYGRNPPGELGGNLFGDALAHENYQDSTALGNSTSDQTQSAQEVTLQLRGGSGSRRFLGVASGGQGQP